MTKSKLFSGGMVLSGSMGRKEKKTRGNSPLYTTNEGQERGIGVAVKRKLTGWTSPTILIMRRSSQTQD